MTTSSPFRRYLIAMLVTPALVLAGCADAPAPLAPDPAAAAAAEARSAASAPVRLEFAKCILDPAGVWTGEVSGDVAGDLRTELTELRVAGPIWHVRFNWIVFAGAQSFVADLSGILNTNTGRVVMNGRVAEGYLQGAQVHEEGQLVDAENSCFAGTIRIMPATAR
jgi:hypothetical protein